MEILTTMSPNESRSWNQFCNVTRLSSKKTNARENCFFSFCKMIFMTFQKSILDLKSLNICRHIDLLPEFKVCILMEVEFLKSVHCRQHIISWQSWKLKLLSTKICCLPPLANRKVRKIVQTQVQNMISLSHCEKL